MRAAAPLSRLGHSEVYAAMAALSFLAARFLPILSIPYVCPAKGLFHIPCPTCGMTHAFVALAHGDLAEALRSSPLGSLLAALAWTYALADLGRLALNRPLPDPPAAAVRAGVALGLAALLVNWAWLLAHSA
jgi:Protein of unknown function (DUF2752)